jgi:hypothetical protein
MDVDDEFPPIDMLMRRRVCLAGMLLDLGTLDFVGSPCHALTGTLLSRSSPTFSELLLEKNLPNSPTGTLLMLDRLFDVGVFEPDPDADFWPVFC